MNLTDYMAQPPEKISLAKASLIFSRQEFSRFVIAKYEKQLAGMCKRAKAAVTKMKDDRSRVEKLNELFFEKLGFKGNEQNYGDLKNSMLNHVLDTRMGIPITLSIVYLELARACGMPVVPVNFPRHFLLRCISLDCDFMIDCYYRRILSKRDCAEMFQRLNGTEARFDDELLRPCSQVDVISRVVNNVKLQYAGDKSFERALEFADLIESFDPHNAGNIVDIAEYSSLLGKYDTAIEYFNMFLEKYPDLPQARAVRTKVGVVRAIVAGLN